MIDKKESWLKLLMLIDKLNRMVKEIDFNESSVNEFYKIKDEILELIIKHKQDFIKTQLSYVPYYRYSNTTKDKAGDLMRKDFTRKSFEYYLSKIDPSDEDIEMPEKATIEIIATIDSINFSFHLPYLKAKSFGIDIHNLPKKVWISNKDFQKKIFISQKEEILNLLSIIK